MARECGSCSLCCKLPAIPVLDKPRNTWCRHFDKGRGCTVYDERPAQCREFMCAWLERTDGLQEEFRPDKVHAYVVGTLYNEGISVMVDPGYPNAFREGGFGALLERLSKTIPVIVVVGSKTYSRLGSKWVQVKNTPNAETGVLEVMLPRRG